MQRTNPPTALVSNTDTAFDRATATTIAVLRELWGRHRYRAGLRTILHFGPHLFADIGMTKQDTEQEANAPFWRSPYVPPLRYF